MDISISVIVPVYNVEKYIRECIQSILNQTMKNIEIIIVNDGSRDNSIEEIIDLVNLNKNIILINKKNGGLSSARNEGLKYATGKYISFVDSDDYIDKNFLKTLYLEAEEHNLDIAFGGNTKLYKNDQEKNSRDVRLFNNQNMSGICFLKKQMKFRDFRPEVWDDLYSRDFLVKNNLTFYEGILHEDEEFTIQCLIEANRVRLVDTYGYIYRQREDSIMSNSASLKNLESLYLILDRIMEKYNISTNQEKLDVISKTVLYLINAIIGKISLLSYKDKKSLYNKSKINKAIEIVSKKNKLCLKDKIRFFILNKNTNLFYFIKRIINNS